MIERFVWAPLIELFAKTIEPLLLRTKARRRRPRGLRFQGSVHAFVPPVLLRFTGLDQLRQDTYRTHQAERLESRAKVLVANGTPLSVRIRVGNPNSLKRRVNTGLASATAVVVSA